MTIPLALAAARDRYGNERTAPAPAPVQGAAAEEDSPSPSPSPSASCAADCLAIVPVLRARFPHAQPHRLPLVVRTRASSHHVQFLFDEDEEEGCGPEGGPDVDQFGRVACRALVLHPTKHKQSGHHQHHHRPRVRTSVDSLPSETLKQVFRFLPAPSLCTAEMVCPHWRAVASEDDAWWGALCEAQFGVSPDAFTPPPDPVKWLYMLQAQSLRSIKRGGGGRTGPGSLV